jgi:hypothetical protein
MTNQIPPILERANYYAQLILDDDILETEALAIGATLAVGEANIIIINQLSQILNRQDLDNGGQTLAS